ncbi:Flp/Fap pilin component family protein [Vibrio halioticoli NBRC 102217]|uniref:Flp/Fap pilin component family protein n=1 Tax=Vibrio halioticoli NBRC 102217 TaxID=1219072 RepID=V5F4V0_9VIBR|nr:Flp/Fap pilin component family protein [Vibrio halioticoli]GAD90389.1 Flp/Fap pilin component family protein [Vibrio halioticoli NBRC 102217]
MSNQWIPTTIEFLSDEEALTVVEYVIAAALLVAVISTVVFSLQVGLTDKFNSTIDSVK